MKKKFIKLLLTLTSCSLIGCKTSDHGYSKCLQYCNEEKVTAFYWTIKTEQVYEYETKNWRFGMCRTPSDTSIPAKEEINTMHKTTYLTIDEFSTLLKETNHKDSEKISIYWTKMNMSDTEYSVWKCNYPMHAGVSEKTIFEELGLK